MKHIIIYFSMLTIVLLSSCNNSTSNTVSRDSTNTNNAAGINNINGNIPDTGSGMKLNQTLPIDSSKKKDSSMPRK